MGGRGVVVFNRGGGDGFPLEHNVQVSLRVVPYGVCMGRGRIQEFFLYFFFLLFISSLYNLASLELRENLLTYLPE